MAFAQRPFNCARSRSSYCVVGDLTAQLWRPTATHCALIRTPRHGVCFENAQSLRRRSPTAFTGDATAFAIVLPGPRRSLFLDAVGSPCERCSGVGPTHID